MKSVKNWNRSYKLALPASTSLDNMTIKMYTLMYILSQEMRYENDIIHRFQKKSFQLHY